MKLDLTPDQVMRQYVRQSADDFMLFVLGLKIPAAQGERFLADVIAPFQRECFEELHPSLKAVRDGDMPPRRRYWIERTKKASKDSDVALCLLWLMAYPVRPILVQVSAANQQQAGIVKRRAEDILFYNPWLQDRVTIQRNRILGHGGLGEVVVEATGNSGAKQGDTPDLLVLNELVHVERWAVNETHMHNADGVPRGVVVVCTNAGIKGTKAEAWRLNALANSKRWTVLDYKGLAPWLNREDEEEARRRSTRGEYARLWRGEWVSGRGDAVDEADIDRCFVHVGPQEEPEPGLVYVAGLDLGVSHDHAGLCVAEVNRERQRVRVAHFRAWEPRMQQGDRLEVDLQAVEEGCLAAWSRYGVRWFGYDPAAGGSFMAQRLRRNGVPMQEVSFGSPANLQGMARAYMQLVGDGRLECYDVDGRLRRDMGKFDLVERASGFRLEATSDEHGHADVGTAMLICLLQAKVVLDWGYARFRADDPVTFVPAEIAAKTSREAPGDMPAEFRELWEMSGGRTRAREEW